MGSELATQTPYRSPRADEPPKDQRERRYRQLECLTCTDFKFPRDAMTEFDDDAITKLVQVGYLEIKFYKGDVYAFMQQPFINTLYEMMEQRRNAKSQRTTENVG